MAKKKKHVDPPGIKTIAQNRRARFDYEIMDTYEGGLSLLGSEVKSLRLGHVHFADAYALVRRGEAWLTNLKIDTYKDAGYATHDPERSRKILLHADEIEKIQRSIEEKGLSVVPLKLYFKKGWAKVLLGVGRGRKKVDKRQYIKERDVKKQLKRIR